MKLALLPLTLVLSNFALAQDTADRVIAYERQKQLNAENLTLEEAEAELGYCIRDLVENGGGGFKGFDDTVKFMEKLQTFPYRPASFIVNRIKRCQYLKKFYSKQSAVSRPNKFDFVTVNRARIDRKAVAVLTNILRPTIQCSKWSLSFGVAIARGGGAKVEAAKCNSSTGRRWIEVRVGGGGRTKSALFNVDLGIAMKDWRTSMNRRAPFMAHDYSQKGSHAIAGFSTDKQSDSHSIGVGVGGYQEKGTMGVLRAIPLGSSDETVRGLVRALY